MAQPPNIDGVLIQWGDRLFYPGNRTVRAGHQPRLKQGARQRAAAIRQRIEATAIRRAPQVMVKVTGGGRGMRAIAAHLRYISKNGRLEMEDERSEQMRGKGALREIADDWRFGGSYIPDVAERREAYNIMLSMPRGTDPLSVQWAAREFARVELTDHKYVMVLHDHQANPHVHISVRAESKHGKRLNPRKADLHRWRETFAEKLRERGIEAEATRQATRGHSRNYEPIWRVKAAEDGRLRTHRPVSKSNAPAKDTRAEALRAWMQIGRDLAATREPRNLRLAASIKSFLQDVPAWSTKERQGPARVTSAPDRARINQVRDAPLDRGGP
ncbi:relaxase/mobilization nuclease domain-containing protein [Piscinibacter koreensis]|uniref:Conjugal transfer protein TraS n=1 Tax=Piscinibacter koreensis TaxID=2742824 RepID=A0A7Y6TZF4_9BURK|nr:relaxase/mobilization nuclease domain-containing protein [Schlegelella koreensis]NUZ09092.1 conjugal transfer protein TraS [Schlegelella koreensis]